MRKKLLAILIAIIVITNFLLFVFIKITALIFWIVIIVCALFAYKILPKIKG